jgi:hypothetical protein
MKIQEQYESQTGQPAMYRKDGADYHTLVYVRWLESRLAEEIKWGHLECTPDNCMSSGTDCPSQPNTQIVGGTPPDGSDGYIFQNTKGERVNIPCDCGNKNAYWKGDQHGRRTYACDECHGYSAGLDTAAKLAEEAIHDGEDKQVLICGIISSKKSNTQIVGGTPSKEGE